MIAVQVPLAKGFTGVANYTPNYTGISAIVLMLSV
nr:MAG TPA_asm: hypothetical protein [Bacteriophage sp.]